MDLCTPMVADHQRPRSPPCVLTRAVVAQLSILPLMGASDPHWDASGRGVGTPRLHEGLVFLHITSMTLITCTYVVPTLSGLIASVAAKMLSVNILIAVYSSHLLVFSYKILRLCRESLILLESHQKIGSFRPYQRI